LTSEEKPLTTKEVIECVGLGFLIAITYTVFLIIIFDWIENEEITFELLPEASAQILPFEQQLEQIRNPQDCTRKVVQGKSATIPFSLKVFYDTTRDNKLEFKQQGTSFPVVQRTNQVMTFYTNGTDQYEIYMEMNYPDERPRQIYIEYLSANQIVQSMQERFDTKKFCMTLFANTILPETQLTKEQIFGESLEFIAKIPAMVVAFNANTQTSATNIAYQWILIFGILILSVLTFIGAQTAKGKFNSKIGDLGDAIVEANKMTDAMDKLITTTDKPLTKIKEDLNTILNIPQIKDNLPKQKRVSPLKMIAKIITHKEKKQDDIEKELMSEEEIISLAEQKPRTESDEVIEALQPTKEEIKEEKQHEEDHPSGGYVIGESEEDLEEIKKIIKKPKKESPMGLQPSIFKKIIPEIDFEKKELKEDALEKFTYDELNESYAWIAKYKKWTEDEKIQVPSDALIKQEIAEGVIYDAVFAKINQRREI